MTKRPQNTRGISSALKFASSVVELQPYYGVYVYVCVCGGEHATPSVWRLEDNFQQWVLSSCVTED